jgi:hypothetical protein
MDAHEQFGDREGSAGAHADKSDAAPDSFLVIEARVRLSGEHTLRG